MCANNSNTHISYVKGTESSKKKKCEKLLVLENYFIRKSF